MTPEEQYKAGEAKFKIDNKARIKRNFRLFVVGGYDGLNIMYYNYHQVIEKVKFADIMPFETFITQGELDKFFLDTVFFEVDNKYLTNIGAEAYALCLEYVTSDEPIELQKTHLLTVINGLEEAIAKSSNCRLAEKPILFDILKKIENYYRVIYTQIYKDFNPFLSDRPENKKLSFDNPYVFKLPKETIGRKVGLLFYTGQIQIFKPAFKSRFIYNGVAFSSGNDLAIHLSTSLNEKSNSIKPYLNETYSSRPNDKNVFYSDKLQREILDYCELKNVQVITNSVISITE